MKKNYYYLLTLLLISTFMVSCEQEQDLEYGSSQTSTAPVAPPNESSPLCFTLNIEGGNYSVGIVDKLAGSKKVTIVTASMCPYTYYYTIPDGIVTPDIDAIEIIATKSSMRYIVGFCDQYNCYSHADTYHFSYFWSQPETLTVIFDPTNYRPDPLPEGVDDGATTPEPPRAVDVTISMERQGGAFELTASYKDINDHDMTTTLGSYTMLPYVSTKTPLSIEVRNTTEYTGQLTFSFNGNEKVVTLGRHSSETLQFSLKDIYGSGNIRIY